MGMGIHTAMIFSLQMQLNSISKQLCCSTALLFLLKSDATYKDPVHSYLLNLTRCIYSFLFTCNTYPTLLKNKVGYLFIPHERTEVVLQITFQIC